MRVSKAFPAILSLALLGVFFTAAAAVGGHLEPFQGLTHPRSNPGTEEKIELGKMLFFDRRLSGDGTMSCATCHIPDLGFGDGQAIGLNYPRRKTGATPRPSSTSPTRSSFFTTVASGSLEDQALFPIMSAFEMNQNLDYLEEEIRSVPEYVELFRKVFGDGDTSRERIALAIAAFERTLVSRNAPLDRYLDGADDALSPEAKRGLEVFTGKGKCTDCHFGVALIDNRFHALEVPGAP